jgi:hypothetical protein
LLDKSKNIDIEEHSYLSYYDNFIDSMKDIDLEKLIDLVINQTEDEGAQQQHDNDDDDDLSISYLDDRRPREKK